MVSRAGIRNCQEPALPPCLKSRTVGAHGGSSRGVENYLDRIQIVVAGPGIDRAGQGADGILAIGALEEGDLLLLDKPKVGAALVNDDDIHRPVAQRRADGPQFLHVLIGIVGRLPTIPACLDRRLCRDGASEPWPSERPW